MKKNSICLLFFILILSIANHAIAQVDTTKTSDKIYIIITFDGGEFIGKIISQNAREILIETQDLGQIVVPKYQIKEMKEIVPGDISSSGEYIPAQIFATRYFLTTNGLPIEKGESYILWNLWGPDFQFGAGENLSVGILTSWIGVPIVGSIKYSVELGENTSLAVGALLGTGSWAVPEFGLALPYAGLTFGSRRSNITFSAGYGLVWNGGDSRGEALLSVAGMTKVAKNMSFVFDSFIVPGTLVILIPGLRFQSKDDRAFQFGFGGGVIDGETFPLPFVQWFKKF